MLQYSTQWLLYFPVIKFWQKKMQQSMYLYLSFSPKKKEPLKGSIYSFSDDTVTEKIDLF